MELVGTRNRQTQKGYPRVPLQNIRLGFIKLHPRPVVQAGWQYCRVAREVEYKKGTKWSVNCTFQNFTGI